MQRYKKTNAKNLDGYDFYLQTLIEYANTVSRELSITSIHDPKRNEFIASWKTLLQTCFNTYQNRNQSIPCSQQAVDEVNRWKELQKEVLRFEEDVNKLQRDAIESRRFFQPRLNAHIIFDRKPTPALSEESKPTIK